MPGKTRYTAQGLSAAQIAVAIASTAAIAKEATLTAGLLLGAKEATLTAAATAVNNLALLDDAVHYDNAVGVAGTAWPVGTAQSPSNSLINIATIAAARKLKKIVFHTDANLGATFADMVFIGINRQIVLNLNGQDVSGCTAYNITIHGTQGGAGILYAIDCNIGQVVNGAIYSKNCSINATGIYTPRSSSTSVFINPSSYRGRYALDWPEITFNGRSDAIVICQNASGPWVVSNSTNAGNRLFFESAAAQLLSFPSNTFGSMEVFGGTLYEETSVSATWFVQNHTYWSLIVNTEARLTAARAAAMDNLITATFKSLITFEEQALATLDQVAPVQNTWYTLLATTLNCRIIDFWFNVNTTGEDLECKITIDGQVINAPTMGCAPGAIQTCYYIQGQLGVNEYSGLFMYVFSRSFMFEGRSIKIEVRKTTNAGAGNLQGGCRYAKR